MLNPRIRATVAKNLSFRPPATSNAVPRGDCRKPTVIKGRKPMIMGAAAGKYPAKASQANAIVTIPFHCGATSTQVVYSAPQAYLPRPDGGRLPIIRWKNRSTGGML
jgi:hypothetical protein